MNYFDMKQKSVMRQFKIAWILFVSIFMLVILFFQYQQYTFNKRAHLEWAAKKYAQNIDKLFTKLLIPTKKLSLSSDCNQVLKPQLEAIDFENPMISGIVISDANNHILCATTEHELRLPEPAGSPSLLGPLHEARGNNGTYLLQKKIGTHYYGIYLLGKIFTKNVEIPRYIQAIALENSENKTLIYQQNIFDRSNKKILAIRSEMIEHLTILVIPNETLINRYLLFKESSLLLSLLFLSIILYLYLGRMIKIRFSLKTALETALLKHKFKPVYQPIFDESKKNYSGAEVLMRWEADKEALMQPELFIIEAEKTRLIIPMTEQLFAETLKESHKFLKDHPDFKLSFNVTALHFLDPDFFGDIKQLLTKYTVNPHQIMFEITERILLDVSDTQLKNRILELVASGFLLAIDDFGTGHASINYLRHFPFTHLKIDQIFVQSIGTGAITEVLSNSIIQLAHTMKLKLIAEGVETKEQYDYLKKNKVNYMQGWYFSKAISFNNLKKCVESKDTNDH